MYRGVNLSGAEFAANILPGVHGTDYLWQSRPYGYFGLRDWVGLGINVVRIPFRWERLQPVLMAPFNVDEYFRLRDTVSDCKEHGITVILDCHNFGRHFGNIIDANQLSDMWLRLHMMLNGDLIYGLMNEPHDIPTWVDIIQETVIKLRGMNVGNKLLVPGNHWSSAHTWLNDNAAKFLTFRDPWYNFAFDVHQYVDASSSGASPNAPGGDSIGVTRLAGFQNWCLQNGFKAFLSEFGVSEDRGNMVANWNMLKSMDPNVWLGWTAWGAGGRWGEYHFALEGDSTPDMVIGQFF